MPADALPGPADPLCDARTDPVEAKAMPPKQKRAQPPSTFRPSAATLSAFQMRAAASAHAPRRPRRPRAYRARRGPKANPKRRRRARARGLFRGGRRSARVPSAREHQTPPP